MAKTKVAQNASKGRRKTSVARAYLKDGSGQIEINGRGLADYFASEISQNIVKEPLVLTQNTDKYDVKIKVDGGGLSGQADAARLAISRALAKADSQLRGVLKKAGFLTCDARQKERKKYGQKKARKHFQFSKR